MKPDKRRKGNRRPDRKTRGNAVGGTGQPCDTMGKILRRAPPSAARPNHVAKLFKGIWFDAAPKHVGSVLGKIR